MKRKAFTLIELMLALSLVVVAAALIGSLMQIYAKNFATRGEDIRRMQLARSILNMVAEDLRAVVTAQEYDSSVLEQQLGSGAGGGAGSDSGGSAGGAGGGDSGGGSGGAAGGNAAGGGQSAGGAGTSAGGAGTSAGAGTTAGGTTGAANEQSEAVPLAREPGLYGTKYELTLDVSRLPRADEYIPPMGSVVSPTLTDVPGDIKTVSYFVQTPSMIGVEDSLSAFNDATSTTTSFSSGLVRRQLDRAIIAYAEELGDTRLSRTGDLIAPEVVSLEFAYFDGTQWLYEWDSSTQALPWLVQITLGMQSATGEAKAELDAGISLSSLTYDQRSAYGILVYELVVAIPGAQLKAADAASAETDSGMSSMGL